MNEKILVVEDDLTLKETLAYNLIKQGYEVETAADGKTAVNLASNLKPDLVILDIMLPVLDGFEVCRILRKDSNVPIIMLTARDDEIERVLGLEIIIWSKLIMEGSGLRALKAKEAHSISQFQQ
jgi:DNA-binding response OmpR family regulator